MLRGSETNDPKKDIRDREHEWATSLMHRCTDIYNAITSQARYTE